MYFVSSVQWNHEQIGPKHMPVRCLHRALPLVNLGGFWVYVELKDRFVSNVQWD